MFELRGAISDPAKENGDNVMKKTLVKKAIAVLVLAFGFLGAGAIAQTGKPHDLPMPGCLPCPKDW